MLLKTKLNSCMVGLGLALFFSLFLMLFCFFWIQLSSSVQQRFKSRLSKLKCLQIQMNIFFFFEKQYTNIKSTGRRTINFYTYSSSNSYCSLSSVHITKACPHKSMGNAGEPWKHVFSTKITLGNFLDQDCKLFYHWCFPQHLFPDSLH